MNSRRGRRLMGLEVALPLHRGRHHAFCRRFACAPSSAGFCGGIS